MHIHIISYSIFLVNMIMILNNRIWKIIFQTSKGVADLMISELIRSINVSIKKAVQDRLLYGYDDSSQVIDLTL